MQATIFSETWDTVRTSGTEITVAETMLKLCMISPPGVTLSTTHAIDSPMLLSEQVAGDSHFLTLVQKGRLKIARWPDGQGPRQALTTALGLPKYKLSGWDELSKEPDLRKLALDVWLSGKGKTGVSSVDKRLDIADGLFRAIEEWEEHSRDIRREIPRDERYGQALKNAPEWIPQDTHSEIRVLIDDLSHFEHVRSRSRVYEWLDGRDAASEHKDWVRDCVDGCYNSEVARSLGSAFNSARRIANNLPSNFHEALTSPAKIELAVCNSPPGLDHLRPLQWDTVCHVLLPYYSTGPYNKETAIAAFEDLAKSVVSSNKNKFAVAGAVIGITGANILLVLGQQLVPWANTLLPYIATALGFGPGLFVGGKIGQWWGDKWVQKDIEAYRGWLDEIDMTRKP